MVYVLMFISIWRSPIYFLQIICTIVSLAVQNKYKSNPDSII